LALKSFPKNRCFFCRAMKEKIRIRLQGSRTKRNAKMDREKHRKRAKKKQAAHPIPLWLKVLSRVD
jgi:hypothetical protein